MRRWSHSCWNCLKRLTYLLEIQLVKKRSVWFFLLFIWKIKSTILNIQHTSGWIWLPFLSALDFNFHTWIPVNDANKVIFISVIFFWMWFFFHFLFCFVFIFGIANKNWSSVKQTENIRPPKNLILAHLYKHDFIYIYSGVW